MLFSILNNRNSSTDDFYKYEKCALIIADFSKKYCEIYTSTDELKKDSLVSKKFSLELQDLSLDTFIKDILESHKERFK